MMREPEYLNKMDAFHAMAILPCHFQSDLQDWTAEICFHLGLQGVRMLTTVILENASSELPQFRISSPFSHHGTCAGRVILSKAWPDQEIHREKKQRITETDRSDATEENARSNTLPVPEPDRADRIKYEKFEDRGQFVYSQELMT
jgi:hypothetical protein